MRFDLVLLVRPSIGAALAFDARRREFCAHQIGVTKGRAGVVAEVKFREIAMQCFSLQCWYTPSIPRLKIEK